MKLDIYQSRINLCKFLIVEAGTLLAGMKQQDPDYAKIKPHRMGHDANLGDDSIAFDADIAIAAIQSDGYYLHQVTITTS